MLESESLLVFLRHGRTKERKSGADFLYGHVLSHVLLANDSVSYVKCVTCIRRQSREWLYIFWFAFYQNSFRSRTMQREGDSQSCLPISRRIIRVRRFPTCTPAAVPRLLGRPAGHKSWTSDQLMKALEDLNIADDKRSSYRTVASKRGIPKSTLYDYQKYGVRGDSRRYLTDEEEDLTTFVLQSAEIGYGKTQQQVDTGLLLVIIYTTTINMHLYTLVVDPVYYADTSIGSRDGC